MAPKKFGLFKGRSREQHEQPSTENLLNSHSSQSDYVVVSPPSPPSPIPSTSRGYHNDPNFFSDFAMMRIADNSDDDDDDEDFDRVSMSRRIALAKTEEAKMKYRALPSTRATSTTTLHYLQDSDYQPHVENLQKFELATADDATSIDVNSIQYDQSSIASDEARYCGAVAAKKPKKNKPRTTQPLSDDEMWLVSDTHVIERLLERNCTINELIKWEAIALARGICTLTTNCVCRDCNPRVPPPSLTDGDAGMASAPFLSAVSIGCDLQ